jgi:16S rRNA (guanine1207-N2)-methyltransferase
MVKLSRHEHYYVRLPKSKKKEYHFQAVLNGFSLEFFTASGIFSPRRIDLGTLTLVKYMEIKKGSKILDLGCAYGAVGIVAAKMCASCEVVMADINERAVYSAKKNIRANGVKNAKAKQSYYFSGLKDEHFDIILLNPPQSAGLDVCYKLIEASHGHLNKGGSLQLVVRRRHGGERLTERMEEIFGNIEVVGKKAGYWVYKSVREKDKNTE